jgi:hypothetical protein
VKAYQQGEVEEEDFLHMVKVLTLLCQDNGGLLERSVDFVKKVWSLASYLEVR